MKTAQSKIRSWKNDANLFVREVFGAEPDAAYDRVHLSEVFGGKAPQALRVGLGFSSQLTISIPAQAHDMRLDILVTEAEILRWPKK